MFFLPLFLFLLWELPAMVVMSSHKLICACTGGSFEDQFLGTWPYRMIGLFVVWPAVMAVIAFMALGQPATTLGELVLLGVAGVVIWARFSSKGA